MKNMVIRPCSRHIVTAFDTSGSSLSIRADQTQAAQLLKNSDLINKEYDLCTGEELLNIKLYAGTKVIALT